MGANVSSQQLERWKYERIDRLQGEKLVREINTEEDIEAAIKALLLLRTQRGQGSQFSRDCLEECLLDGGWMGGAEYGVVGVA
jgi:hypothetical protein